jgi:hypothetical protein
MTTGWSLRVLTPTYFDVESLLQLRARLVDLLQDPGARGGVPAPDRTSFTVVDDSAGHDPAIARLSDFDDVTVVSPPFNLGHQRAIVYGLRSIADHVKPDEIVVTMDSDGEDRPEDVLRLVRPLLQDPENPWTVSIARRTHRKESPSFKALYLGFRMLFRLLTGREVRSGNYAALHGEYVRRMIKHPYFDLCYSATLISLNPSPTYVPCARGERYAGQSHMGIEKLLNHGVRMLMPFADRIAIRSLAFFSVLAACTTVFAAVVLGAYLGAGWHAPAWAGWVIVGGAVGSSLALVNFLVLFSGFAQSSALSLRRLDPWRPPDL